MNADDAILDDVKAAILADTHFFLVGLGSGASHEHLKAILVRIRTRELQLIKEKGIMLTPVLWRILQNRIANRRPNDIIDTME
ncbi:hypothetical protein [Puia dinghuensis]|nr:hypothetical protein [Puia dinghuensis]